MTEIKILSYNIWWKAMTPKGNIAQCLPLINKQTSCLHNIVEFIDNNEYFDFVGLQEATNWKLIQKSSTVLSKMNAIGYNPNHEDIVIFYDKNKYELDDNDNCITGHMKTNGRPFMILFLTIKKKSNPDDNQNICIINAHSDHNGDIYEFDFYLKNILIKYKNYDNYLEKFKTYNIIMMGDFNDDLNKKKSFVIFTDDFFKIPNGRKLYGTNKEKSCCSGSLVGKYIMSKAYDHILSTSNRIITQVHNVKRASDHMPIIATIQFPNFSMTGGNKYKATYYYKYLKYKTKYLNLHNA